MRLVTATEADIGRLMCWFPDQRSTSIWGGPMFRYPFTPETFQEDTHWRELESFCVIDPAGDLVAFGQIYERHGRINLARLVVRPDCRGRGVGTRLVHLLMEEGRREYSLSEFSLYVCRDNHPAMACYRGLGFGETDSPDGDELGGDIIYMTRPV